MENEIKEPCEHLSLYADPQLDTCEECGQKFKKTIKDLTPGWEAAEFESGFFRVYYTIVYELIESDGEDRKDS